MLNRNTQKIISLLYYQEDVAKPIAEFVGLVCNKQDSGLATELIKELTETIIASDRENMQGESSGVKSVAKFFSKLSKQAPKACY